MDIIDDDDDDDDMIDIDCKCWAYLYCISLQYTVNQKVTVIELSYEIKF